LQYFFATRYEKNRIHIFDTLSEHRNGRLSGGIRKKLGDFGKYIETVRGVGYRFMEKN